MEKTEEKFLSCEVGESNKLLSTQNYYVRKLKMFAIMKQENFWNIVEIKRLMTLFLIPIVGRSYTKSQLATCQGYES